MTGAGTFISLRKSIKRFEEQCSQIVEAIEDLSGEEIDCFENDLDTILERLREESDKQTRGLLGAVKAKKPSVETRQNDPTYTMYKCLLQEITTAMNMTTVWVISIFEQIKDLISLKIEKNKKKFVDIDHYLVSYIIDELCDLFTRIFVKHRLFIHDIWQALQQNKACAPIRDNLLADMNEILQRWVRHFEMTEEKLKIRNI